MNTLHTFLLIAAASVSVFSGPVLGQSTSGKADGNTEVKGEAKMEAGSASEAVKGLFKAAMAQDLAEVKKRLPQYAGAAPDVTAWLEEREQKILAVGAKDWGVDVLEEKVQGDCAVVVMNESNKDGKPAFDLDPAYLIRQNGEWRVLPKITVWNLSKYIPVEKQPESMKLTEQQTKDYTELAVWFEERSKALTAEYRATKKAAVPSKAK